MGARAAYCVLRTSAPGCLSRSMCVTPQLHLFDAPLPARARASLAPAICAVPTSPQSAQSCNLILLPPSPNRPMLRKRRIDKRTHIEQYPEMAPPNLQLALLQLAVSWLPLHVALRLRTDTRGKLE